MNVSVDMTDWILRYEWNVYHRFDCLSNPEPVLDLVSMANSVFPKVQFDLKITANRLESFRPRDLLPTARNWKKVRDEISEGRISTLMFGSARTDGFMQLGIVFHMYREPSRLKRTRYDRNYDSVLMTISYSLFSDGVIDLQSCHRYMELVWERLDGYFGYGDMFLEHRTGRVNRAQEREACHAMMAKSSKRQRYCYTDLRSKVPETFWLNFLNSNVVERLHGYEHLVKRMSKALPNSRVYKIPNDGVAIQLSPEPRYTDVASWERDFAQYREVISEVLSPQT